MSSILINAFTLKCQINGGVLINRGSEETPKCDKREGLEFEMAERTKQVVKKHETKICQGVCQIWKMDFRDNSLTFPDK